MKNVLNDKLKYFTMLLTLLLMQPFMQNLGLWDTVNSKYNLTDWDVFDFDSDIGLNVTNRFSDSLCHNPTFSTLFSSYCPQTSHRFSWMDMTESEDGGYTITMDVPGMNRSNVNVTFKDDMLLVYGSHHQNHSCQSECLDDNVSQPYLDRTFSQVVSLPTGVNASNITASVKYGVLVIGVPPAANQTAVDIEVL